MLRIAADPKHLSARIGITAVLHTWGSALTHHPHVHMVVPGGGIALDGQRWVAARPAFLLPVRVLGVVSVMQKEPKRDVRNDRVVVVPSAAERAEKLAESRVYLRTDKVLVAANKITRKVPVIGKVGGTTGDAAGISAVQPNDVGNRDS